MDISYSTADGTVLEFSGLEDMASQADGLFPISLEISGTEMPTLQIEFEAMPSCDDLIEAIFFATEQGTVIDSIYTQGDCDVFAVALQRLIPEGQLIAIYDIFDPFTGRKSRGAPYLIHAGLLLDDIVLDIRGARELNDWVSSNRENGEASENWGWREVSISDLEKMQRGKITEQELEHAMPWAELVKAICRHEIDAPLPSHAL